jgi:beta-N-acetylhexosaminidase
MKPPLLSLKEKIGQLFMIGFHGTSPADSLVDFVETNNIGSVLLFSRNIDTIPQVIELNGTLHSLAKVPPLIYTDQEGGSIVRFKEMAATVVSPMGLAATGQPEYAETAGRLIGEDMDICGVDGVLAPVLDVNVEEDNPVIGLRSFSDQPEQVVEYAERFCRGLSDSGILACGKHYPGHGAAKADSHLEIPVIPVSRPYFTEYCLHPFDALARQGIDALMTGHLIFPEISPDLATFSPYLIRELLREKLGYQGVVFTDCLEMKAVIDHYSPEAIVLDTMAAGVDVLVASHTPDFQAELLEILVFYATKKSVIEEKRIDESLERILTLKQKRWPRLVRPVRPAPPGDTTPVTARKNIALEREIADQSVTLIKNSLGVVPLGKSKRVLVLEWRRRISGPGVAEKEDQSMIGTVSARYLANCEHLLLNPGESLAEDLESRLKNFSYVIALIYSRTGENDYYQTRAVRTLLGLRKDTVIVSLENPYEIKKFPFVDTFLVTYGYRLIQIEALFKILTGVIPPQGKLPLKLPPWQP